MNTLKLKIGSAALSFFLVLVYSPFSLADDTEIFFSNSASSAIKPNVLFVMDTSGSMTNKDGGTTTRLDRMKTALKSIISSSTNVNIGLMRFVRTGGSVLYPVADIDSITSSSSIGSVTARITESSDDAEEDETTHAVTLDEEVLSITTKIPGFGIIDQRISSSSDDAEERSNGSMYLSSTDLEIMTDGSDQQKVGLRFPNLVIPTGATILSASIEFVIDEDHTGSIDVDIFGEQIDSGTFSDSNDVSGRTKTTASRSWPIIAISPSIGDTLTTPDLTNLVQEIVSNGAWNNTTQAITFIMELTSSFGRRTVESFDGDSSLAPRLLITYQDGVASSTDSYIGLRFQDLEIPQGVTITSASIDFSAATASSGTASYTLRGEDVDDSGTFLGVDNDISGRTRTTATVNWAGASDWDATDDVNSTPDLTAIVQEITDRTGWCGGNSMSFLMARSGANLGSRFAKSFDDNATNSPTLRVTYDSVNTPAGASRCTIKEYVVSINSDENDAEEKNSANHSMNLASSDIEMINDGGTNQLVGLRFEDIFVPNGAVIKDAYISFSADGNTTGATSLVIQGEDADSSDIFTSSNRDISDRTLTTASATWSAIPSWTSGEWYNSPDLSTVIKEVVDRSGWVAGNDMTFVISGSGNRQADTHDENAALAAKLVIKAESYGEPVTSTETVRDELLDIVDDMINSSGTPIVDALYEAALYYRGDSVDIGKTRGTNDDSTKRYDRASHEDSYSGGAHNYPVNCTTEDLNSTDCVDEKIDGSPVYISPIVQECQTNNIILLSDGQASLNNAESKVKTLANISSCAHSGAEACGPELAKFLYEQDQLDGAGELSNSQNIKTYTIGFNFTSQYFKDIATAGGGEFYEADSSAQLVSKFEEIFQSLLNVDTTFVSPGVTVNSFNRLNHRDELYFSLFRPDTHPLWSGNLKRYRLDKTGDIYDNSSPSKVATDSTTGFFDATSKSWWSSSVDGNIVASGGAAEQLPSPNSRKIYTYYAGSPSNLASSDNALTYTNNANITKARLGIDSESDSYHEDLINWARGVDINDDDSDSIVTEARNALADPLHSIPHLVTYGGTSASPDITIYYGDNQGFVHAIDGDTGVEEFAFIPEALLPNLNTLFVNSESSDHPYGMDGAVTTWVNDANGDGQIVAADGDHVYLYVGMRRGGRNYYALDVTDRSAPEMLWTITGGSGDFGLLGQSWSKPAKTQVKINNSIEDVLIFSGGYDENQDGYTIRTTDTVGAAVYMVDASTGAVLWSGGSTEFTEMQYSIPSDIRIIDINGDGLLDQMYFGDMGGQIWRLDVNNGANASSLVSGGVIADFGGATAAENRRFYHAPDVSVLSEGTSKYLMIAIGSGFQAHPLEKIIEDRFYVIRDENVYEAPATYTKLAESDLYDATENHLGDVSASNTLAEQSAAVTALATKNGWFIKLEGTGEKALATSTTVAGELFFTTYEPTATNTGCTVSAGTPWLYNIDIAGATPVKNYDEVGLDTQLTKNDRKVQLNTPALPPAPQRLRIDGQDIICVGTECETIESTETLIKTYWVEED